MEVPTNAHTPTHSEEAYSWIFPVILCVLRTSVPLICSNSINFPLQSYYTYYTFLQVLYSLFVRIWLLKTTKYISAKHGIKYLGCMTVVTQLRRLWIVLEQELWVCFCSYLVGMEFCFVRIIHAFLDSICLRRFKLLLLHCRDCTI